MNIISVMDICWDNISIWECQLFRPTKNEVFWRRHILYFMRYIYIFLQCIPNSSTTIQYLQWRKMISFERNQVSRERVSLLFTSGSDRTLNFEYFCHTSIITNFDIFNLEPTLFMASRTSRSSSLGTHCDFVCIRVFRVCTTET